MTTPKENSGSLSEYQRISGNLDAIEETMDRHAEAVDAIFEFCAGIEMICRAMSQLTDAFKTSHEEIKNAAHWVRDEARRVHMAEFEKIEDDTDPDGGVI